MTFLSPLTTAIAGALLLGESFTRKEAFAGSTLSPCPAHNGVSLFTQLSTVFSLIGVVLIARPTFIFGNVAMRQPVNGEGDTEKGTPTERLVAVG